MVSARVRPGNGEGAQDQVQAEGVRPLDVEASTTAPDEDADGVGVVVAPDGVAVVAIEPGPLEDLERRLRQVSSAYVQLQGEMQSLRERSDRLQEERDRRRRGEVVTSIFEPVQNLQRSLEAWRRQDLPEGALQGLQLVVDQFQTALRRLGLESIQQVPAPFDPSIHDAICAVPVQHAALDGQVVQVFEAGYRVGNQVIQPARVVIGRYQPPAPPADDPPPEPGTPADEPGGGDEG